MAGSKAAMNRGALPALKDAARLVKRSSTSPAGSPAALQQAARASTKKARRSMSGPVAGVDADVAFGEVAGPEAGFAPSLPFDVEANLAFRRIEFELQVLLGKGRRESGLTDQHALHVNVGL